MKSILINPARFFKILISTLSKILASISIIPLVNNSLVDQTNQIRKAPRIAPLLFPDLQHLDAFTKFGMLLWTLGCFLRDAGCFYEILDALHAFGIRSAHSGSASHILDAPVAFDTARSASLRSTNGARFARVDMKPYRTDPSEGGGVKTNSRILTSYRSFNKNSLSSV